MIKKLQTKMLNHIKRTPAEMLKLIALIIVMGFATQVVASVVLTLILDTMPEVASEYKQATSVMLELTPKMMLFVCVMAPLFEELFFRGLIFGVLKKFAPFLIANITQALAFGIYHGNIIQGIYAFLLGMFIGVVLLLTGSLCYTILLHMSINFAGLFIGRLVPENTGFVFKLMLVAFAVAVLTLITYHLYLEWKKSGIEIDAHNDIVDEL